MSHTDEQVAEAIRTCLKDGPREPNELFSEVSTHFDHRISSYEIRPIVISMIAHDELVFPFDRQLYLPGQAQKSP